MATCQFTLAPAVAELQEALFHMHLRCKVWMHDGTWPRAAVAERVTAAAPLALWQIAMYWYETVISWWYLV